MEFLLRYSLVVSGVLISLITGPYASGQSVYSSSDDYFAQRGDTTFIKDYKYLLTSRYYLLAQNTSFVIFPEDNSRMTYKPNETGRFGVAAFYSWFGLGLSVGTKLYRKDPEIYGNTKSIDFRVNAFGKFLTVEGYLQTYKGFYLNYDDASGDKQTYIIPDMSIVSIGIEGNYIYNYSKFSIRAAFIQNERQLKSAGSLIVKPTFRYFRTDSDQGIIPQGVLASFGLPQDNILSGNFYTLGLGPGYIYTFVFGKRFYLTTGALAEVDWSHYQVTETDTSYISSGFTIPLSVRCAAGYNSDTWFIGASYISTVCYLQPGGFYQDDFHYYLTQIRFWVGTRFDAFRKWNKKK